MSLRTTAARGVLINGGYLFGLNLLTLVKAFATAGILSQGDFGIWGILSVTLIAMLWLKDMGVSDRFVAQREDDQERAFQQAFSVELLLTGALLSVMAVAIPLLAFAYGRPELVAPGLVLALLLPGLAFQAPIWLHYRELRFVRQRSLQAIDPLLSFGLTIGLALLGAGYWSLVAATVVGTWVTALAALRRCPYRVRWVMSRAVLRDYWSFSWPLFVGGLNGLIITQLAILGGNVAAGLAGVAAITLASTVWRYAQRVDEAITQTMFPVVAKVIDRPELMRESFLTSNRLALLCSAPFGLGFVLYSPDLVRLVLGEEWRGATLLLQLTGLAAVVNQIGFNWTAYFRSIARTRPLAIASWCSLAAFLLVPFPLLLASGLAAYGWGTVVSTTLNVAVRRLYLRSLFPGLRLARPACRALAPGVLATGLVALGRLAAGEERPLLHVLAEFGLFAAAVLLLAFLLERRLLAEVAGYVRRPRPSPSPAPVVAAT